MILAIGYVTMTTNKLKEETLCIPIQLSNWHPQNCTHDSPRLVNFGRIETTVGKLTANRVFLLAG